MLTIAPIYLPVDVPPGFETATQLLKQQEKVFELYYSQAEFKTRTTVESQSPPTISGLYVNLGARFACRWPITAERVTFHPNHFSIIHLPYPYTEYCTIKGMHQSLIVNVSTELLKLWADEYDQLDGLTEALYYNRPYIAGRRPFYLDDRIVDEIKSLISGNLKGEMKQEKVYSSTNLTLLHCVEHLQNVARLLPAEETSAKVYVPENSMASDKHVDLLKRTEEFLTAHLDAKLSLNYVADEMNVHPKMLTRLFQFHHRRTMMDWLYLQRMKAGQVLLATTTRTVLSIAKSLGYSDATHFAKAFKRKWGYEPSITRKITEQSDDDPSIHRG